ncbi:MAG TPA: glycosyltransferase family 4 protein [Oscillospiraceae bacterium]|nr:glycosyltransferase family 4 protein [Oscillospiraceae bacterium]HPF56052.1 glycosyltransferase family 4 protein [Clostridiales bacterium]HPK36381.1 glycosyltransferase family 4 protein [Oscillospiraceae bacterium]HPR75757.1 glycosyltransferase family 4 protein [Oscillospiraceae bacterium]
MTILFYTNLPSPYRVDFFNLLGQSVDLSVVFTDHRSQKVGWIQGDENIRNFKAIFLCDSTVSHTGGQALHRPKYAYPEAIQYAYANALGTNAQNASGNWDAIFVTNYCSPTEILLFHSLKQRKIPYILEVDGGFIREENALKRQLKKYLISGAKYYLTTGKTTDEYLSFYGADETKVRHYPLSSVFEAELADAPPSAEEKAEERKALGLPGGLLCLFAGQLIHRKGVDLLVEAAKRLPGIRFCVVGNGDSAAYCAPDNVIFAGQKSREELAKYYRAADLFVLPTREDIWGLVVNEAAAKGLPVITTDRCIAGLEMLDRKYIIPAENADALTQKLVELTSDPDALKTAAEASLAAARRYTIEEMVRAHLAFLADL